MVYCGDDSDPESGSLSYTSAAGETQHFDGGFLFEDTTADGTGPDSVHEFVRGCLGQKYYEGASAQCGRAVVRALEAMYKSGVSGSAEVCL